MSKEPYYIRAVLDIYALSNPECVKNNAIIKELHDDGLIEQRGSDWFTTPKGTAYVEALKRVPLPVQKWAQP